MSGTRKSVRSAALSVGMSVMFAACSQGIGQPQLGGYVKFYHHNRFEGSAQISRSGTRLQLRLDQGLGDRGALFGSVDIDVDDTRGRESFYAKRGTSVDIYPVEMYVDFYWPNADLRLGKQFVFWGKTEWINPTDNINPWDYANMSAEIEDYRLPVNAARLDLYVGPATLELVVIPVFTPHRIPGVGSEETHGPIVVKSPFLPPSSMRNAQAGFRLLHSFAGIDWSASYYRGFDHTPAYRVTSVSQGTAYGVILQPYYPRMNVIGGDCQKVFGSWGVRAEAAYFRTEDQDGTDPLVPNPHAQGVFTFDYTPSDRLALALQGALEHRFRYDRRREEACFVAYRTGSAPPATTSSLSGRLRWKPADYWDSQVIFVWNRETKDRFVLAFVNYQPADALNVTVGGVLFGGEPDTPFGRMRDQDRLFVEVKASF